MMPFELYPGGAASLLGKCTGANCRHEYGLKLQRLTGQTACAYCGLSLVDTFEHWLLMSVDHVVPTRTGLAIGISRNWLEDYCNTVLCCSACNGFGNRFKIPVSALLPAELEEFVALRDKLFVTRKELILAARKREQAFYASRPWEGLAAAHSVPAQA